MIKLTLLCVAIIIIGIANADTNCTYDSTQIDCSNGCPITAQTFGCPGTPSILTQGCNLVLQQGFGFFFDILIPFTFGVLELGSNASPPPQNSLEINATTIIDDLFVYRNGRILQNGPLTVTRTFYVLGLFDYYKGNLNATASFENHGVIQFWGTGPTNFYGNLTSYNYIYVSAPTTFTANGGIISNTGTMFVNSDFTITGSSTFSNTGTIQMNALGRNLYINSNFVANNIIDVQSGSIYLMNGVNVTGTINIGTNGQISLTSATFPGLTFMQSGLATSTGSVAITYSSGGLFAFTSGSNSFDTLTTSVPVFFNGTLTKTFKGTQWTHSGYPVHKSGGAFVLQNSTFTNNNVFIIESSGDAVVASGTSSFVNQGTLQVDWTSSGTGASNMKIPVSRAGQILVSDGTLNLMASSSLSATTIYSGSSLSLQNGTFSIDTTIKNNGTLEFYNGAFTGSGTITSTGVFSWTGGNITGYLHFDVTDCVIGGGFLHVLERDVVFAGNMNITSTASIYVNSLLEVKPNGILRLLGPATLRGSGSFTNEAPIVVNTVGTASVMLPFNHTGAYLDVQSGELHFFQAANINNNVMISSASATLTLDADTYPFKRKLVWNNTRSGKDQHWSLELLKWNDRWIICLHSFFSSNW